MLTIQLLWRWTLGSTLQSESRSTIWDSGEVFLPFTLQSTSVTSSEIGSAIMTSPRVSARQNELTTESQLGAFIRAKIPVYFSVCRHLRTLRVWQIHEHCPARTEGNQGNSGVPCVLREASCVSYACGRAMNLGSPGTTPKLYVCTN